MGPKAEDAAVLSSPGSLQPQFWPMRSLQEGNGGAPITGGKAEKKLATTLGFLT